MVTLRDPGSWIVALAAFLVRGGIVIALAPILVLPSVAGLANAFGPLLIGFVFTGPTAPFVAAVVVVALIALAWLVVSTAVGAWLDVGLASEAAAATGVPDHARLRTVGVPRAVATRLIAHIPTAIVVAWAAVAIVDATYQELIAPGAPSLPVPVRVALRVPDAVVLVLVAWLLGETIGGIALRRLAGGDSVAGALSRAVTTFLRPSSLATFVATVAVVGLAIAALAVAPAIVFDRVQLVVGSGPIELLGALLLLVATWLGGLLLLAIALAWRQVAWTLEVVGRG